MLPLRLSKVVLATLGIGAALLSLPSSLLGLEQDTVVKPVYQQPVSRKDTADEAPEKNYEKRIEPISVSFRLGMPKRLAIGIGNGDLPSEQQLRGDLFTALIDRKNDPPEAISPIKETTVAKEESPLVNEELAIKKPPTVGKAQRVVVPSVGIDIAVKPGTYDVSSASWQLDDTSAFHADTSVPVNDTNGTTLIYGHARWGIFGALPDVQPGAEVTIYTAEGIRFIYTLELVKEVDPSDLSLLTVEGEPKLVLQTCSGFFDQYRTLALFGFKEILYG